ncbi:MAG TPA: CDP-diacylglycerol--serine O-phosphatidyltransferase [Thermoanaerobaculia bacterium]|nr:CDP-diacylglycerol--serine O-phosphatidyltransferase [Thermoanaerobaculia bacterium]
MKRPDVRKLRRGIYVIPTTFTVLNLFFGFRSMIASTRAIEEITNGRIDLAIQSFEAACIALFIAAIFDTFDGLVARQLGATSEFGKEYDSLADVVTFGAAPAVLIYAWGLHILGNLGAGVAFLFLVSGSLRLARFNVMTGKTDHRFFVGLPIPSGALTLASIVYYAPTPVADRRFAMIMLGVTIAVAFAMVSPIRYRSQKGLGLQKERSIMYFVALAIPLALALVWTKEAFFIGTVGYLLSGPAARLWSFIFPRRASEIPPEHHGSESHPGPAAEGAIAPIVANRTDPSDPSH